MALTASEQELFNHALAAMPNWFKNDIRTYEFVGQAAKIMGTARTQVEYWLARAFIETADGATGSLPDWLAQHGRDRGTDRQASETDVAMRARIKNVPDIVTRPTLLSAAQAIVNAEGITGLSRSPYLYQKTNTTYTPRVGGTPNSLAKTSGVDGLWNAFGHAATYDTVALVFDSPQQFLAGDGYLEFTADQSNKTMWVGMVHDNGFDPFDSYPEVQYAFELVDTGVLNIMWHNLNRLATTYVATDVLRITFDIDADTVVWSKNGTPLYTETDAGLGGVIFGGQAFPCTFSAWFKGLNGSISDIEIYDADANNVFMVELRRDKAFLGERTAQNGTGGTFAGVAPDMTFEPDTLWTGVPYRSIEEKVIHKVIVSGAASGGNDGTFPITGLTDNAANYSNSGGVTGVDATVSWTLNRYDRYGNLIDGFRRTFLSRGHRFGHAHASPSAPPVDASVALSDEFIIILPYGSTTDTVASVLEMLRQKKAGGIIATVERRTSL